MRPPMEFFMSPEIGAELIYSFVIIVCSLMIYFGTKELYDLSSHKGIKYFRQAFLFFALAYFFRSAIIHLLFLFDFREILDISPRLLGISTLFLFVYFSSMAIFSLLYSVMWKRWNGYKLDYLFYFLSFVIAFMSLIPGIIEIRFILNCVLFGIIIFTVYTVYKDGRDKKKRNNLYAIYFLLFLFFLLNVFGVLIPRYLDSFNLVIYLASTGIFLLILYKVIKKTGN